MGIYVRYILPRLTHLSMGQAQLQPYRSRVIGGAKGKVLEIGFGSGCNLPYYPATVDEVVGVDVSAEMLALAAPAVAGSSRKVTLFTHTAERLPFDDQTFDTVVTTWSLCSIPDPVAALREARRVLKPGGQLRFIEHGLSADPGVAMAEPIDTPVAPLRRRVSPQSEIRRFNLVRWVHAYRGRNGLCTRTSPNGVHVRRVRNTLKKLTHGKRHRDAYA